MVAKGKTLLKIAGVLLIIFGLYSMVSAILVIVQSGAVGEAQGDPKLTQLIRTMGLITLVGGSLQLAVGIICFINAAKTNRAMVCIVLALVMLVMQLGNLAAGGLSIALGIGIMLSLLALTGGILNRKAANGGYSY